MSNKATLTDIHAIVHAEHIQVAAVYDSQQDALNSIESVIAETAVEKDQITLINPMDPHFSEKLERASSKIGKTLWSSHLKLGFAGLVAGLIVAALLVQFGPALTKNNPLFTYIALISPGLFIGLFIAGLTGLRPDRHEIIETVRSAIKRRKYALVVNLKKGQQVNNIKTLLGSRGHKVTEAIQ
ncbi:MAG: hypothetical protein VYE47_04735 [Pseudomonadota bacterium]|nr:hypothetical protein [Pseudomonadota bacterium]